ncbi:MAG: hypothetical protein IJ000_00405 [Paludibacteraceae bacterium]|nr:hypothetical protein [Paludibacteraceae bacterium]
MYTREKLKQDAKNFARVLEWKLGNEAFKKENVNAIIDSIQEICNEAMQSILLHAYFKGINDAIQFYQEKEDVEALRKIFYALHDELKQSK